MELDALNQLETHFMCKIFNMTDEMTYEEKVVFLGKIIEDCAATIQNASYNLPYFGDKIMREGFIKNDGQKTNRR